jgi:hypothetical protein
MSHKIPLAAHRNIQVLNRIMKTLQILYTFHSTTFFLQHSCNPWNGILYSFSRRILQISLEILEVGICSSVCIIACTLLSW